MSIKLSANPSNLPVITAEEMAKMMGVEPGFLRRDMMISSGGGVPNPDSGHDQIGGIKMDCGEGLSDIERINFIFSLSNEERFQKIKGLSLKPFFYGSLQKIYNVAMNLLLFEQEMIDSVLHLFTKELEAYQWVERRLNYIPENLRKAGIGQNGKVVMNTDSPEAFQLYRMTHMYIQDHLSGLSGISMREISEKEERSMGKYCQSSDKILSDLANIIICTSQIRRITLEIEEKWLKPVTHKWGFLNIFYSGDPKGNQLFFTYLVPRLIAMTQKMMFKHKMTGGQPKKLADIPLFQGVVDLIKGLEGKKSVQRQMYVLFDQAIRDIAHSQKQRESKLEILKLRWSRNEELFPSITDPLPSTEKFLADPEIVVEKAISSSQHKKKKPVHAKQKKPSTPVKKSEKPSAPAPIQEPPAPVPAPKEEWLSMPLNFIYGERVRRWFSVPKGGGAPYATFPIASQEMGERVRIHHSFSRQVDKVIHLSQYVHKDKQGERLYAVAQMSYPDGSYDQGVIGWGLTQRESGLECYHRYFTKRDTQELIDENIQKIFYQIDFPSLSEAVLPPAEELLQEEGTTTVFRSEALDILHFDDRYNGVRVSVLPLQNKL